MFADDGSLIRKPAVVGLPALRPAGVPTPCGKCEKVPRHARAAALPWQELRKLAEEMTPANRAAWGFYRACRATGTFPDDPLVRWYSVIIRDVEDAAERLPLVRLRASIDGLVALLLKGS